MIPKIDKIMNYLSNHSRWDLSIFDPFLSSMFGLQCDQEHKNSCSHQWQNGNRRGGVVNGCVEKNRMDCRTPKQMLFKEGTKLIDPWETLELCV